ncbi:hypothetical protein GLOIN_2v1561943 [Rhizophagus irregularis DAOM 181602=DAOM 197198]|uniref:Uncharacterized protein n=1 Tax=Rhizophagus irregularis (strain DAOM 181602 / DAOM 197198 / MUCL 43194) TaxID=747089 RepID=A0A2P4QDM3_RHIID|nr:hypothetical protein GLOIN_2v1561943 [Rhizophagus irregularis DAOM 181602=DAOM 197198]PKY30844.1 hypothetical protein RhiirB3_79146 [Rhizophagus irregularis]POG75731.1 hypothetical protein GLOIN_2v1561943 [Rhizophagus irregularis DAOM 181602=DAOM 197198]|eukprot:XP_025182597.1 hypothetical protein GLOIN_2v1561943 [Rhizophagus irregularis DAOM 181602=DAOM 197198]
MKKSMNFPTPNTYSTLKQKGSLLLKSLLHGGIRNIQIFKSPLILFGNGIIAKMKILSAIISNGASMEIEIRVL